MAQHYFDETRAGDPHALPDVETFYLGPDDVLEAGWISEYGEHLEPGWYWWACFPGCLPDGDPNGPFETEDAALEDARDW